MQQGMTLVELVVGVMIVGILLALAVPSYQGWIQSAKIRTTIEAILNGVQLARAEAVRRNAQIRFQLTDNLTATCALSTSDANWVVSFDDPTGLCANAMLNEALDAGDAAVSPAPRMIQVRSAAEGSANLTVTAGQSTITYNGLGRITPVPAATINIDVSDPTAGACAAAGGTVRCMRVAISTGGQIRLCDPARASTDPQGC
jgi:type IV fimbrial biogenesis protein FimT